MRIVSFSLCCMSSMIIITLKLQWSSFREQTQTRRLILICRGDLTHAGARRCSDERWTPTSHAGSVPVQSAGRRTLFWTACSHHATAVRQKTGQQTIISITVCHVFILSDHGTKYRHYFFFSCHVVSRWFHFTPPSKIKLPIFDIFVQQISWKDQNEHCLSPFLNTFQLPTSLVALSFTSTGSYWQSDSVLKEGSIVSKNSWSL